MVQHSMKNTRFLSLCYFLLDQSENYDDYLTELKDLLDHIITYADKIHINSKETAIALRGFNRALLEDRANFESDRAMLKSLSTISTKAIEAIRKDLDRYSENAGQYKVAIEAATNKIKEWQNHVICLTHS